MSSIAAPSPTSVSAGNRQTASSLTVKQWTIGLKRNWRKAGVPAFLGWCGGCWLVLNLLSLGFADIKAAATSPSLALMLLIATTGAAFALTKIPLPLSVSFPLRGTGTTVDVEFADLFDERDHIAVPVNEHFDCEIGLPVSPNSVHGQLIARLYDANQKRFEKEVDEALAEFTASSTDRQHPRSQSYPIGTTAAMRMGSRIGFLFALAKTDPVTHKASSTVALMGDAMAGLWKSVRDHSGGRIVSLPLVGGGQSGLGFIGSNELLRNILLSAFVASKDGEITKRIRIVLHADQIDRIDLRQIEKEWK